LHTAIMDMPPTPTIPQARILSAPLPTAPAASGLLRTAATSTPRRTGAQRERLPMAAPSPRPPTAPPPSSRTPATPAAAPKSTLLRPPTAAANRAAASAAAIVGIRGASRKQRTRRQTLK
jgi:hypothetical protein